MKLQTLSLSNFKCFDSIDIDFSDGVTTVRGANGSGKTTIYDAYCWLLFGKNSHGQTFDPRPKNNNSTKTTVAAKIQLKKGDEVYLSKTQKDKGVKETETAKAATETTYSINGVLKRKKDYDEYISTTWCAPDVFSFISDPLAFAAGREKSDWQKRRDVLVAAFSSGESDGAIIDAHPDIAQLRQRMNYQSPEDFLSKTQLERKNTAKRLDEIPIEINTYQDTINTTPAGIYNPSALIRFKAWRRELMSEIDRIESGEEISSVKLQISKQKAKIDIAELKYRKTHSNAEQLAVIDAKITANRINISDAGVKLHAAEIKRDNAKCKAEEFREKYSEIASRKISIEPICPTCRQELPEHLLAQKKSIYNSQRAEELKAVRAEYDRTVNEYRELRNTCLSLSEQLETLNQEQQELTSERDSLEKSDEDGKFKESDEYKTLSAKLGELEQTFEGLNNDNQSVVAKKRNKLNEVESQIEWLESARAMDELVKNLKAKIEKLKEEQRELGRLLAQKDEDVELVQKFTQYKISDIEQEVNSHFETVKWKLFEPQVNGLIRDCCEATVGGVGFNEGLNSAAKINAGIDIINALSEFYGLRSPVWVDNAESVTDIKYEKGQQVRLYVDESQLKINIKNGGKLSEQ